MTKAKPTGRPSSYTEELGDIICERIAGGDSLRTICAHEAIPDKATVFRWLASNEAFRDRYARAKSIQLEAMADELLDIVDDGSNDWMEKRGADGEASGYTVNGEAVQRSKLRADTRKWLLAKLAPKKYGERVSVDHGVQDSFKDLLKEIDGSTRGLPEGG